MILASSALASPYFQLSLLEVLSQKLLKSLYRCSVPYMAPVAAAASANDPAVRDFEPAPKNVRAATSPPANPTADG